MALKLATALLKTTVSSQKHKKQKKTVPPLLYLILGIFCKLELSVFYIAYRIDACVSTNEKKCTFFYEVVRNLDNSLHGIYVHKGQ